MDIKKIPQVKCHSDNKIKMYGCMLVSGRAIRQIASTTKKSGLLKYSDARYYTTTSPPFSPLPGPSVNT